MPRFASDVIVEPDERALRRRGSRTEYSAGGVMVDRSRMRAVLIGRINRRGRLEWCLPKGHIEDGETPRQAAEREVFEETGICGTAGPELGRIDYWFHAGHRKIHKHVYHYLLEMYGGELCTDDHEVTDVAWFPLDAVGDLLRHNDEREIISRALTMLADS
jgi:8-oxo-dGTP pyrophosphatase MutT (NUDIX family)